MTNQKLKVRLQIGICIGKHFFRRLGKIMDIDVNGLGLRANRTSPIFFSSDGRWESIVDRDLTVVSARR